MKEKIITDNISVEAESGVINMYLFGGEGSGISVSGPTKFTPKDDTAYIRISINCEHDDGDAVGFAGVNLNRDEAYELGTALLQMAESEDVNTIIKES